MTRIELMKEIDELIANSKTIFSFDPVVAMEKIVSSLFDRGQAPFGFRYSCVSSNVYVFLAGQVEVPVVEVPAVEVPVIEVPADFHSIVEKMMRGVKSKTAMRTKEMFVRFLAEKPDSFGGLMEIAKSLYAGETVSTGYIRNIAKKLVLVGAIQWNFSTKNKIEWLI